jgi:hypothetical protein
MTMGVRANENDCNPGKAVQCKLFRGTSRPSHRKPLSPHNSPNNGVQFNHLAGINADSLTNSAQKAETPKAEDCDGPKAKCRRCGTFISMDEKDIQRHGVQCNSPLRLTETEALIQARELFKKGIIQAEELQKIVMADRALAKFEKQVKNPLAKTPSKTTNVNKNKILSPVSPEGVNMFGRKSMLWDLEMRMQAILCVNDPQSPAERSAKALADCFSPELDSGERHQY